jgi:hypothetical protein
LGGSSPTSCCSSLSDNLFEQGVPTTQGAAGPYTGDVTPSGSELVPVGARREHDALEGSVEPSPGSAEADARSVRDNKESGLSNPSTEHCSRIVPAGAVAKIADAAEPAVDENKLLTGDCSVTGLLKWPDRKNKISNLSNVHRLTDIICSYR